MAKQLKKLEGAKLAEQIAQREKGLYRLTATDVNNIECALRLRIESCEDNNDHRGAAVWKRTHAKFI